MTNQHYFNYQQLTDWLQQAVARYPQLARLQSLGQSHEGRDIWLLTLAAPGVDDRERPALWVDGNLHAAELSGTQACLRLAEVLLEQHPELLQQVTFYIAPRVCPDGAELTLQERPRFLRSSVRPYPHADPLGAGIEPEDIDGNGKVLTMRLPDPNGPWKACPQEPRLLVRRQPEDREGPFYRLLPEGRWEGEFDPDLPQPGPVRAGLDLNRNFPFRWRPEGEQKGAGPFPASEPEVAACVRFLTGHPNVCQAITFHTFSGVFLRPYSTEPDESLPPGDLELYKFFGEKGTQLTGYPHLCVYHDFRYHPKEVITGTFDDWVYDTMGAFAWTVEIWSVLRKAGITQGLDASAKRGEHRFIRWFEQHPIEEEIQLLRWCESHLGGKGFEDWRPYQHPQLGPVEIGGWDMFYLFRNPPMPMLEEELEPLVHWVLWLARACPRLQLAAQRLQPLGDGLVRLELVVDNAGWLPSYASRKALERKLLRGLKVTLELPDQGELIEGKREQELGQLEGVASRPNCPLWHKGDASDQRIKVSWVVRSAPGARWGWSVCHERAGTLRGEWTCP